LQSVKRRHCHENNKTIASVLLIGIVSLGVFVQASKAHDVA
jgi:hypothetical protein